MYRASKPVFLPFSTAKLCDDEPRQAAGSLPNYNVFKGKTP